MGIIGILEHDKMCVKKSMNRIHNTIVEYYLKNGLTREVKREKQKIDSQVQFYLYDHLVDKYFRFLYENGYSNESEFLREIYYNYIKKSKKERIEILKKFKEESC